MGIPKPFYKELQTFLLQTTTLHYYILIFLKSFNIFLITMTFVEDSIFKIVKALSTRHKRYFKTN